MNEQVKWIYEWIGWINIGMNRLNKYINELLGWL